MEQFEVGRSNVLTYTTFIDRFVQGVVGFNIFRKNCAVNKYSEYVSVSDEAMTYLILASNWEVWSEMAEWIKYNPKGTKEKTVAECSNKQLYHIDGKGRGYSWSAAGKEYYNKMYDNVIKDRMMNPDFDKYFQKTVIDMELRKAKLKDKRKQTLQDMVDHRNVRCRNDNTVLQQAAIQETYNMPPAFDIENLTSSVHSL